MTGQEFELISVASLLQGSLIANMIMGMVILRRRYDLSKYVSVMLITLGIAICTIVSGSEIVSEPSLTYEIELINHDSHLC